MDELTEPRIKVTEGDNEYNVEFRGTYSELVKMYYAVGRRLAKEAQIKRERFLKISGRPQLPRTNERRCNHVI